MQRRDTSKSIPHQSEERSTSAAGESSTRSRWLRTPAAAAHLGLAAATLEKMRCTGGGPRFSKLGRAVVYELAELDRWAASRTFTSTAAATVAEPGK